MSKVDELTSSLANLQALRAEAESRIKYLKAELSALAYPARNGDSKAESRRAELTAELVELDQALTGLNGDLNSVNELLGDARADQTAEELGLAQASLDKLKNQAAERWIELDDLRIQVREKQLSFELAVRKTHDAAALIRGLGHPADGFTLPVRGDVACRAELEARLLELSPALGA